MNIMHVIAGLWSVYGTVVGKRWFRHDQPRLWRHHNMHVSTFLPVGTALLQVAYRDIKPANCMLTGPQWPPILKLAGETLAQCLIQQLFEAIWLCAVVRLCDNDAAWAWFSFMLQAC